jgi:hypothetical protein
MLIVDMAFMRAARIESILAWVALLLLAGCATEPSLVTSGDLSAIAVRVKGCAHWKGSSSSPWQALLPGTRLPAGSAIETGSNESGVDIALGNTHKPPDHITLHSSSEPPGVRVGGPRRRDNYIHLYEGSCLTLNRLVQEPHLDGAPVALDVRLRLSAGRALCAVTRPTEGSNSYEIDFVKGVASARGTLFEVTTEGIVKVLEGSVLVTWPGSPGRQIVMGFQMFDIRTGVLVAL